MLGIALGPVRFAFEFERDRIGGAELHAPVPEFERHSATFVELIGQSTAIRGNFTSCFLRFRFEFTHDVV
jgi:hypothetical protein